VVIIANNLELMMATQLQAGCAFYKTELICMKNARIEKWG